MHEGHGGEKVLLKKAKHHNDDNIQVAAAMEDLFHIIHEVHLSIGHGKELALYRYVTRQLSVAFSKLPNTM